MSNFLIDYYVYGSFKDSGTYELDPSDFLKYETEEEVVDAILDDIHEDVSQRVDTTSMEMEYEEPVDLSSFLKEWRRLKNENNQ